MNPAPQLLEQITALLAAPPPRTVPPELWRAATRQTAPLLFILIGAFVGLFGMMFVLAFFPWNLTRQWRLDAPGSATTAGKIVSVESTGTSISKTRVMRSMFEFSPPDSSGTVRGTCYTTGSPWSAGAAVVVRYRPDNPSLACVEGARLTKTSPWTAFVLIILAPGVALTWVGLLLRHRTKSLLVHGHVTEAYITALERTETQFNNDHVFRIVLKRVDRPDDPPMEVRKHDPAIVAFARGRLESKLPVFVLFDPKRPKRALLPEVL